MLYDLIANLVPINIKCLDKGFVELVDVMPRMVPDDRKTADFAIVQAARVSFGPGTKQLSEDTGLIRYLMRHSHTTPFEMVEFKFHAKMPIFIARQWIRHRTANVNELSGRYSVLPGDFFIPELDEIRKQSTKNKQVTTEIAEGILSEDFQHDIELTSAKCYDKYLQYIDQGIGREQARMLLPLNLYTEWYWKIDLHNLFHFLGLRCHSHAQAEMRVFADAMLDLITPIVPIAVQAWKDYHPYQGGMKLSAQEVEIIRTGFAPGIMGEREIDEWNAKALRLGLTHTKPH